MKKLNKRICADCGGKFSKDNPAKYVLGVPVCKRCYRRGHGDVIGRADKTDPQGKVPSRIHWDN